MEKSPATNCPSRAVVTQRVPLVEFEDLLARPARAAIAHVGSDGPECLPVVLIADVGMRIGVNADQLPAGGLPEQAVLAIDDGADGDNDRVWFGFEPRRVAAWDCGQLHEEPRQ